MTHIEKNIIQTYSGFFENLSAPTKAKLLEKLMKLNVKKSKSKDDEFLKSFGAFVSEKSAEELVNEIRDSRKFRDKEIEISAAADDMLIEMTRL